MDRRSLLPGWGLRNVEASDAPVLNAYFATLAATLLLTPFSHVYDYVMLVLPLMLVGMRVGEAPTARAASAHSSSMSGEASHPSTSRPART